MLYNLVRGPQVCQLFSCYVSPSINKVLTYLLTAVRDGKHIQSLAKFQLKIFIHF